MAAPPAPPSRRPVPSPLPRCPVRPLGASRTPAPRAAPRVAPILLALALGAAWACPPFYGPGDRMAAADMRLELGEVGSAIADLYAYRDFRGADWEALRRDYGRKALGAPDAARFYGALERMVAELDDDHSVLLAPWDACAEDGLDDGLTPGFPPAPGGVPAHGWVPSGAPLRVRAVAPGLVGGRHVAVAVIPDFDRPDLAGRVEEGLEPLLRRGPLDALVLDLRGNPGGYVDAAYALLGDFVDGVVGTQLDERGATPIVLAPGRLREALRGVPLAVLVDAETHSAAEVVAGVLQAERGAVVAGETSAGNTEVVVNFELPVGGRLWLAVGGFRLRDGYDLEGSGVVPDAPADPRRAADPLDAALLAALAALGAR